MLTTENLARQSRNQRVASVKKVKTLKGLKRKDSTSHEEKTLCKKCLKLHHCITKGYCVQAGLETLSNLARIESGAA